MRLALATAAASLLLSAAPAFAQADTGGPAIEPEAMAALTRMGRYLQTLKTFSVKGATSSEEVLPQGLKVRYDLVSSMEVSRPDHVRAEQTSDRRHRQIVYDGGTFSVYSKSSGYYAQAPATGTIHELGKKLQADYAVELPLLDLFVWADEKAEKPALQVARVVGLSTIRGVACDQYAFRQGDRDWQVWIQRGAQPLPRRIVVTATANPARPQAMADYDWTLNPPLAAGTFKFTPPPGAVSVPLQRVKEIAVPKR
ncbi:DUF2092 domain-containing protein [Ramlibacter sp. USB13]|uniref:DUF2092 domain-containing protein n=1 Tax=Ramlibacter cellulosilyticus TaxID=2764187 RepID=A0A923MRE9_9BURK|nr:DUF2092 domain-containing protein [Ramlibacter cellulosilyticus]MBC5783833.1 DUF2092 domain-containing protein [Ramlibacter cellulosilyticus]